MVDRKYLDQRRAHTLDRNLRNSAARRLRNSLTENCINETKLGTHGPATHGVLCRKCRAAHRGVPIEQVEEIAPV